MLTRRSLIGALAALPVVGKLVKDGPAPPETRPIQSPGIYAVHRRMGTVKWFPEGSEIGVDWATHGVVTVRGSELDEAWARYTMRQVWGESS